ncbi:MAG: glycoside hydrolase family 2, partial [Clostridia bacterium]|nr:glycoside hydrolase family 2 [Clostridia bacterium]
MVNGKPRLCLNGKPYLFNGLLDQGYFHDGIFLPATPEGYEKDILLAKSMGFNTLRKHIKVEPQIFYYLCDTLGIAVFQDMVNNSKYSFFKDTVRPTIGLRRRSDSRMHNNIESRAAFKKCMKETVNLLYNFPSVVYYTIFNEGWGQFDSELLYAKLCDMDQTRIVDSASGWFTPKESDVDSRHIYFRKPVLSVGEDRPLVLSEFGGYSHRVKDHLFGEKNYGYTSYDS